MGKGYDTIDELQDGKTAPCLAAPAEPNTVNHAEGYGRVIKLSQRGTCKAARAHPSPAQPKPRLSFLHPRWAAAWPVPLPRARRWHVPSRWPHRPRPKPRPGMQLRRLEGAAGRRQPSAHRRQRRGAELCTHRRSPPGRRPRCSSGSAAASQVDTISHRPLTKASWRRDAAGKMPMLGRRSGGRHSAGRPRGAVVPGLAGAGSRAGRREHPLLLARLADAGSGQRATGSGVQLPSIPAGDAPCAGHAIACALLERAHSRTRVRPARGSWGAHPRVPGLCQRPALPALTAALAWH